MEQARLRRAHRAGYGSESENQFLIRVERIALLTPEKAEAIQGRLKALPDLASFRFDPETGDKIDVTFKKPVTEDALQGGGGEERARR